MSDDLDGDGLPLFPPLPGGRPLQIGVGSLARLVTGLQTAVLTVRTDLLAGLVVFLDREPIDGLLVRDQQRVIGPEALDHLAEVPLDRISATEIAPELARVLGSYFLATEVSSVPAGLVVAETFVLGLARPGQRGCVIVRAGDSLGFVFLTGGRVALAFRQDSSGVGGFQQVASLFDEPGSALWARLGPERVTREASSERPAASAAPPPAALPLRDTIKRSPMEAVTDEIERILGPHAVRVEHVFRQAEPSVSGLRAAAESLKGRRVRLVSPATMQLVSDHVNEVLRRYDE